MFNCQVCDAKYVSVSGLNKHLRTKHKDTPKVKNLYYCNDCDASFDLKSNIIKHTKTHLYGQNSNMLCSYTNCTKSFPSIKGLIVHLKSHNINIEPTMLNFNAIEDFNKWKKNIEEEEECQYVKLSSKKKNLTKEYVYYFCHRSFGPRTSNKGHKCTKSGGSVKTGHVCPSNMKVHIDNKQINVQYYSTHLWHTKDIGKLRLFNEDRSKIAGKLSLGVPVNRILQDVRSSNAEMDSIKRIHLLEKKDIYNIKRDFNISLQLI